MVNSEGMLLIPCSGGRLQWDFIGEMLRQEGSDL